jgi:hypothetical protein
MLPLSVPTYPPIKVSPSLTVGERFLNSLPVAKTFKENKSSNRIVISKSFFLFFLFFVFELGYFNFFLKLLYGHIQRYQVIIFKPSKERPKQIYQLYWNKILPQRW